MESDVRVLMSVRERLADAALQAKLTDMGVPGFSMEALALDVLKRLGAPITVATELASTPGTHRKEYRALLRRFDAVNKLMGDLPLGPRLMFFFQPKGSLGGLTPIEALACGKLEKVKDTAAAFADVR